MKTNTPAGNFAISLLSAVGVMLCPVQVRALEPATMADVDVGRFEKEILVSASHDAIQCDVLSNGDVIFAEFWGQVKRYDAATGDVILLGRVPTYSKGEVGMLGMAVAPDFLQTGFFYCLICPVGKPETMRVSRFTITNDKLALDSEQILLEWLYDTEHVYHMGGGFFMDGKGDLWIGNGDNSHWNPGLPLDLRPDRLYWDALRSAGNSRSHRGKILRIHPKPEGGYSIPEDNLFPDGVDGLAEIYAMGVRNPFRFTVDDRSGYLYWGDVGPNVMEHVGVKPHGYDEINVSRKAGNYGWPLFIGPNEPYPIYDFEKMTPIETYSPDAPVNKSPRNKGIKNLPPAIPALIYYPNGPSKKFPTLGIGGRSIMAGPLYHFDSANPSPTKLPKAFDGRLFIYEWMRNWIQTVDLGSGSEELKIEPFLPHVDFRRPIDMKLGPDGALYMIEYGELWWENPDSQLVRIVYRRGNRPPKAVLAASTNAGKHPLNVVFDSAKSNDPDNGKTLEVAWRPQGDPKVLSTGATLHQTFDEPGSYTIELTVTDSSGSAATAVSTVQVGNTPPAVTLQSPRHGSFFDWNKPVPYQVSVTDPDGEVIDPNRVVVHSEFKRRRYAANDGTETADPGLALMRSTTCFACHMTDALVAGPPYLKVAEKYRGIDTAREMLASKVIKGGAGVWGELPMPPHPQHSLAETRQMIDWILALSRESSRVPQTGLAGSFTTPAAPEETERAKSGVFVLTASYTDGGAEGAPPLRREAVAVLHHPQKKAALYDMNHGMQVVDQDAGEHGLVGHFENNEWIVFRDLNLAGIKSATIRAGVLAGGAGWIELRKGTPSGSLIAKVEVKPTAGEFHSIPATLSDVSGLTDVCVVARFDGEAASSILGFNWVEFDILKDSNSN
jgi:cytochrome c